jgi:hypothetical protein
MPLTIDELAQGVLSKEDIAYPLPDAIILVLAPFAPVGRVFDIGKENGDLLALAFQGGLGGEDFLDQMTRSIA